MSIETRSYRGKLPEATAAFQRDSVAMAEAGWYPASQSYVPGSWSGGAFVVALLLCIILIGILVFIYMIIVKPAGTLVVTYEYRGIGASSQPVAQAQGYVAPPAQAFDPYGKVPPGYVCGRCGKPLSPAWVGKCQHCRAKYVEFPPRPRT